eukprot:5949189-Prymnesium_polylepis.1
MLRPSVRDARRGGLIHWAWLLKGLLPEAHARLEFEQPHTQGRRRRVSWDGSCRHFSWLFWAILVSCSASWCCCTCRRERHGIRRSISGRGAPRRPWHRSAAPAVWAPS